MAEWWICSSPFPLHRMESSTNEGASSGEMENRTLNSVTCTSCSPTSTYLSAEKSEDRTAIWSPCKVRPIFSVSVGVLCYPEGFLGPPGEPHGRRSFEGKGRMIFGFLWRYEVLRNRWDGRIHHRSIPWVLRSKGLVGWPERRDLGPWAAELLGWPRRSQTSIGGSESSCSVGLRDRRLRGFRRSIRIDCAPEIKIRFTFHFQPNTQHAVRRPTALRKPLPLLLIHPTPAHPFATHLVTQFLISSTQPYCSASVLTYWWFWIRSLNSCNTSNISIRKGSDGSTPKVSVHLIPCCRGSHPFMAQKPLSLPRTCFPKGIDEP